MDIGVKKINLRNLREKKYKTILPLLWLALLASPLVYAGDNVRTVLNETWTTSGELSSYELTYYYYTCDPKGHITVVASPEDGGSVSGGGEFLLNRETTITAVPDSACYVFKQWSDGDNHATRCILVTEDKTYTAEFTPVLRTIRASVKDNVGGSVSVAIKKE